MAKSNKKQIGRSLFNLRKNKGSVLFLVVAIMSVMVILASALYYSLSTARRQVEVRYDGQQAYQSAVALNDILTEYISIRTEDAFVDAILGLEEGQQLTTTSSDGSDFSEIGAGLGNYKVTITKIEGGSTDQMHILKIETEVDVNGEKSVISSVGQFELSSRPYTFDRFFTSTGYAPNDVVMSGMTITSTMYLDNEYSQIGSDQSGNAGINIEAEIICAGTLSLNNAPINANGTETFDITVGNNLIMTYEGGQGAMNLNGGRIRVGGNLIQGTSFNYKNDTDVYVVGDFISGRPSDDADCGIYVNGDAAFYGNEQYDGHIYVNGDVYLDKDVNSGNKFAGGLTVGGNVYVNTEAGNYNGQIVSLTAAGVPNEKIKTYSDDALSLKVTETTNNGTTEENQYNKLRAAMDQATTLAGGASAYEYVWPSENYTCEALDNVKATINNKLGNPEYANWDMTKFFKNEDGTYKYEPINFNFNGTTTPQDVDSRFEGTGSNANQMIISAEKFGKYVIMGDTRITSGDWNGYNIVIDTTMPDGKDIDMYVYLPANCYMEKIDPVNAWETVTYTYSSAEADKGKFNCYRWNNQPTGAFAGWFSVLVKGRGSVVFVIDDNVTYMAQERLFMGHYNLLKEILPNSIKADGKVTDTNTFSEAKVSAIMTDKAIFKPEVVAKYDTTGGLHNNTFFTAINKNSDVNFDAQYNTFCGFLYAPYMTFGAGKSTEGHFAMLGGLIVSDYTMPNTSRTYMATLPYDYYDRFVDASITDPDEKEEARMSYMESLISASGGNLGTLGSSTSRTWRKYGYN